MLTVAVYRVRPFMREIPNILLYRSHIHRERLMKQ